MKQLLIAIGLTGLSFSLQAQVADPVSWKFEAKKKADGSYDIVAIATVENPWHIYSQNTGKGPIPTKLIFKVNPLVELQGKPKEIGKLEKVYDPNFKSDVLFYSNTVQFVQAAKLKAKVKTKISGAVEYMVCNDEQCLPPTKKPFDISLQ